MDEYSELELEFLNFRKQKGGVSWDKVRDGTGGDTPLRMRCTPDKKFFDALDGTQKSALDQIEMAHMYQFGSQMCRVQQYLRSDRAHQPDEKEYIVNRVIDYNTWVASCKSSQLPYQIITDYIDGVVSMRVLERRYNLRNGTCMETVCEVLDMYCFIKGWKRSPFPI